MGAAFAILPCALAESVRSSVTAVPATFKLTADFVAKSSSKMVVNASPK